MNRIVQKVKIFANNDIKSNNIKKEVINILEANKYKVVDRDFDLGIAIGGDGAFLRMVRDTNFNSDVYFIGINTGTLGFAQEIRFDELENFVNALNLNLFKVEYVSALSVSIKYQKNEESFYALNDITVRDGELNTSKLCVMIDDHKLEDFVGDGLLISSSFGSTAYNLSFGGCVVCNELHTTQITPIAPLNSKAYRSLCNSIVIPQKKLISIVPHNSKDNLIVTVDGENRFYENVLSITISVKDKRIKCFRKEDYNFVDKVNEKFLT